MELIKGKFNEAKVFTSNIEGKAYSQILELCCSEQYKDSKIRIMPDVHAGMGCTIGTTMTINSKVCPNLVGVDIGCGMLCVKLKDKELDFKDIDRVINRYIPSGFDVRDSAYRSNMLDDLRCFKHVNIPRAYQSIGTLGGGNHFIEVNKDDEGSYYLVIHSGSRNLGAMAAKYYQDLAFKRLTCHNDMKEQVIKKCKAEKREKDIDKELKEITRKKIGKNLAWLEGQDLADYLHDIDIIQRYAVLNRKVMAGMIMAKAKLTPESSFETIHNYINPKTMILRKGAVSANKGEILLVPISMSAGSLLCVGKGNPDWNYSAPHGAGRVLSRSAAKRDLSMEEFKSSMEGIYTTSVHKSTLDEAPQAYKTLEEIVEHTGDTMEVKKLLKPVYNFKAN